MIGGRDYAGRERTIKETQRLTKLPAGSAGNLSDERKWQLNAPRLVRQRCYQELDMLGNLPGIMFGVLPGGVTADLFVHRKADQEPGPVVVAL